MKNTLNIQMVDVVGQYRKIKSEIDEAVLGVLGSGQYILGKEVAACESAVAHYLGVKHAIGCASGTDALQVAMMALGIGPGDEVVTTPFTFVATAETVVLLGARPVYADIDPMTFNLDPARIERAITPRTKAIMPVHLYGHPADMDPMVELSRRTGILIIEDMAQAIGAEYRGTKVGSFGAFGCISFYPSKNLGAFGDAGMVVTNDGALAERVRMIINHGSRVRYQHEVIGVNSRLDALQAAILRVKLKHLDAWQDARRRAAEVYNRLLDGADVVRPIEAPDARHVYHQYTLRLKNRDRVVARLTEHGIPHAIYYPIPLHRQEAFREFGAGSFPISEQAAAEVLSLPMHTELTEEQQRYVVDAVKSAQQMSS
jgi:dTDP-4-amino-4,6-dideoxygalactose transaminase